MTSGQQFVVGVILILVGGGIPLAIWSVERKSRRAADRYAATFGIRRLPDETTPELMGRLRIKLRATGGWRS